ncbi:MAG: hypothetical protein OEV85_12610 [Candidatus Thorarchaeota archaeon]|nr:hypothetical protein [Candidatus Thorarchaeota archaeon]
MSHRGLWIQLITFLAFLGIMFVMFSMAGDIGFAAFIPFGNMGIHADIIFVLISVSAVVGVGLGMIFVPIYLTFGKMTLGKSRVFGYTEVNIRSKNRGFKAFFFPALMAINFSLLFVFTPGVRELVVSADYLSTAMATSWPIVALFVLLVLTVGIAVALFSAAWFILDSGIIYVSQNDSGEPIEARPIGGWYMGFLKGYAGIGVIFAFYSFVIEIMSSSTSVHWSVPTLLFPLPIIVMILAIPAVVLLKATHQRQIQYVRNMARKMGIEERIDLLVHRSSET